MVLEPIHCPDCDGIAVIKHGTTAVGKQRYRCQNSECERSTFIQEYSYAAYGTQVKQQISEMAINGSGIRDTARVLGVSTTTVMKTLKKKSSLEGSE
jgi:insertion element IS1 protein InsB